MNHGILTFIQSSIDNKNTDPEYNFEYLVWSGLSWAFWLTIMHMKVIHDAIICKWTTILTKKFDKLDSGMVFETCSGKVRGLRFFDKGELISGLILFPGSKRPAV